MRMSEALVHYEALKEAVRPRLSKETVRKLREHVEFLEIGDELDRQLAIGLGILLDMHDKLEAIRNGQA